ncbi:MAG: phage tail tape measure C-terminal domain-containing protein [Pseudomonadota bacterium]
MDEIEDSLVRAGEVLSRFADGPVQDAAISLEQAFGRAGLSIERALGQAARSGELEFRRMAESVLADLARIAAEAVIAQSRASSGGQIVNLNMSVGAGTDTQSVIGAASSMAGLVAAAAARGARYG